MSSSLLFPHTQSHFSMLHLSQEISCLLNLCGLSLPLLPIGHCYPDRNACQISSPEVKHLFFLLVPLKKVALSLVSAEHRSLLSICSRFSFSCRERLPSAACFASLSSLRGGGPCCSYGESSHDSATAVKQTGTNLLKIIHRALFQPSP